MVKGSATALAFLHDKGIQSASSSKHCLSTYYHSYLAPLFDSTYFRSQSDSLDMPSTTQHSHSRVPDSTTKDHTTLYGTSRGPTVIALWPDRCRVRGKYSAKMGGIAHVESPALKIKPIMDELATELELSRNTVNSLKPDPIAAWYKSVTKIGAEKVRKNDITITICHNKKAFRDAKSRFPSSRSRLVSDHPQSSVPAISMASESQYCEIEPDTLASLFNDTSTQPVTGRHKHGAGGEGYNSEPGRAPESSSDDDGVSNDSRVEVES